MSKPNYSEEEERQNKIMDKLQKIIWWGFLTIVVIFLALTVRVKIDKKDPVVPPMEGVAIVEPTSTSTVPEREKGKKSFVIEANTTYTFNTPTEAHCYNDRGMWYITGSGHSKITSDERLTCYY